MNEKIRAGREFKTEIDGNLYSCYMYTSSYNLGKTYGGLTISHHVVIRKIIQRRFICWSYSDTIWSFDYFISSEKLFQRSINREMIDDEFHYPIDDVKLWVRNGISWRNSKLEQEKKEKERIENTIHKKFI